MTETKETPRTKRRGLGRGLDALLGGPITSDDTTIAGTDYTAASHSVDGPVLIELDPRSIDPNPEQPRTEFDPAALQLLTESIRHHGVLHPIVVERHGARYQLVAGERRWRASQAAGVSLIPAIVRPAAESARHALELALTENLVRADLTALEEASAYSRLADTFGLTHEAVGIRVGRSRPHVSNTIRLLSLPAEIQTSLAAGNLSAGHARALLAVEDPARQLALAKRASDEELSVRAVERLAGADAATRDAKDQRQRRRNTGTLSDDDEALRRGIEAALGAPVTLERRAAGGRISVEFYSDEDLTTLYDQLGGRPL